MTTAMTGEDVQDINQLVTRLIEDDMFTNIEYTGYTYNENAWTVNVVFTLSASVGRE